MHTLLYEGTSEKVSYGTVNEDTVKDLFKIFLFFGLEVATLYSAIFLLMAALVWSPVGMFWYGLGLVISGAALNATVDWIDKE